jgi:hypothetical protein
MMPLTQEMTVDEGRQIMDEFALAASKELQQYLP